MLTIAQAQDVLREAVRTLPGLPTESRLAVDAVGSVLARHLVAARAVPGFACSAMDGYALRLADLLPFSIGSSLREDGVTLAGVTEVVSLGARACRRITTGAPLPDGADTVVPHEQTSRLHAADGAVHIEFRSAPALGAHVRSAIDDFARGYRALAAGSRLDAVAIAVSVAMGFDTVEVRCPPSIAVVTTGDELLPAGAPWRSGLRYDSNGPLLQSLLANCGMGEVERLHARDDVEELRETLRKATSKHRLVIVTGGVSAGEADHLPRLCAEMGSVLFWKLRFRPGMPALLARVGESLVLGLPGNPVSVLATFVALVRPALAEWLGCEALDPQPISARLTAALTKSHDRLEWRRGSLRIDDAGIARVAAHPTLSSGALRSLVESNVLLELAADRMEFAKHERVPVRFWKLT